MNVRNIASRNTAQPIYCLEVEYMGVVINVQGYDLEKVKQELWDEIHALDTVVMAGTAA